jgi:hypothetical protein
MAFWQWIDPTGAQLNRIEYKLDLLLKQEARLMATIQDVQNAVTANTTVVGSTVTLLQQLTALLKAAIASNDPAAVQGVVDAITANTNALAQAVAANTPAP